ncbi:MAG TPA: hypothetical protein DDX39_11985 [Bacteroidales bacterium]|nr:MAG: hypothetical protein A2W98_10360 [Bacteroidetes bacterium GWF2_33_38]HBF89351.1 hypothetical protein [Bacteroidales bacterium]
MTTEINNTIHLKAYSIGELAKMYDINWRTLKKWIEPFESEVGKRRGRFYTIIQVKVIFEKLGMPSID